ncbi:hypothetical protein JCM8097_007781 [Rhodosporidiobolus ruineniae]
MPALRPLVLAALTALVGFVALVEAGTGFTNKKVVSGYFPSYSMQPANVPYSLYTHIHWFVMTTTPDPSVISTAGISDSAIVDFVTRAKAAGVTTSYTIGGWTGSQYFSTHVSTPTNRVLFANALVAVMNTYGFDGIDIDWEYPVVQGEGSNIISPQDSANFLLFLQTLRSVAGENARLSMAANVAGLYGADGTPLTDMSGFAAVLDYVTIMTYDITGTWSGFTGANSPLTSACSPSNNPYSITSGVNHFIAAGFQANHILFGLPAYSYSYYVNLPFTQTTCSDGSTSSLINYATTGTTCGNYIGNGQQYTYAQLVANGWFNTASRFRKFLDSAAYTVTLFQPSTGLFIPTETPNTAWIKAKFAFRRRLAGVDMFDISGDSPNGGLATGLRQGLNLMTGTPPATRRMAKRHLEERRRKRSVH